MDEIKTWLLPTVCHKRPSLNFVSAKFKLLKTRFIQLIKSKNRLCSRNERSLLAMWRHFQTWLFMSVSFEHLICVCQFLFLVFSILTFVFFCQLKLFQFARLSLSFPFAACKEIGIHSMYCMPVRAMMMMVMMMVMMMIYI